MMACRGSFLESRRGDGHQGESIPEALVVRHVVRHSLDLLTRKQHRPRPEDVPVGQLDLHPVLEVSGLWV